MLPDFFCLVVMETIINFMIVWIRSLNLCCNPCCNGINHKHTITIIAFAYGKL